MAASEDRLRPPPAERFAGPEHQLDLGAEFAALRREQHDARDGHRQKTVYHRGSVRLVIFAFDRGGRLPQHSAPGVVTIHAIRGSVHVRTPEGDRVLDQGQLVVLDPLVPHDVHAPAEADMLLCVALPAHA
ncbi:MAG TPA: hypothetical protein VG818_13340 [Gemmatimonadaceae bacterium]|nr:hypothetical protein [Gemmatimonadaceae bacterium]